MGIGWDLNESVKEDDVIITGLLNLSTYLLAGNNDYKLRDIGI